MRALRIVVAQWLALSVSISACVPEFFSSPPPPSGVGGGGDFGGSGGGGFGSGGGSGGFGGGSGFFDAGSQPFCSTADMQPIIEAARPPPAISGGTMTVLSDGSIAVADSDRDQVYLVAPTGGVSTVPLLAGDEPGRVTAGPNQTVFVALRGAGAVVQLDVAHAAVMQRLSACAAPRGLAWDDTASALHVACSSGELVRLDFSGGGTPTRTVRHPLDDLRDVLLVGNQLLVTTFRDPAVYSVAADGSASFYARPAAAIDPSGLRQFKPQVAWRTVSTSAGLVMSYQQEETTPLPTSVPCGDSAYGSGGSPSFDAGMPTVASNLALLAPGAATDVTPMFAAKGVLPVDVAASLDGTVAVAYAGSQLVSVTTSNGAEFDMKPLGTPVALAFRGQHLLVFERETATLDDYTIDANLGPDIVTPTVLASQSVVSTGHDLFHRATANGIACASCHPEGGEDGHVWALQEGIRRTPSLRGGLSGTEPFHWSGEEPELGTLMTDIFTLRMGGTFEPLDHVQALQRWLDAQPSRPPPTDLDPAAVQRGATEFTALGCGSCHSGSLGTNNSTVDVGTDEAFQVPRLVELAYRAPFLHDGRAPTLEDRFSALGGLAHAGSSGLTPQQISDLVAYLKSR